MDYSMTYSTSERIRKHVSKLRGGTISAMVVAHPNGQGTGKRCRFVVAEKSPYVWIEIAPQKGYDIEEPTFCGDAETTTCAPADSLLAVLRGRQYGLDVAYDDHYNRKERGFALHGVMASDGCLTTTAHCHLWRSTINGGSSDYHVEIDAAMFYGNDKTNVHEVSRDRFDFWEGREARAVADWLEETLSSCAKCA